jgi:uncharacterized repeat protein (TIGR03803 family)
VSRSYGMHLAAALLLITFLAPGLVSAEEQTLYRFAGGSDGYEPAGIIEDNDGNLYGVTIQGGDTNCYRGFGCGTVFELTASGTKTTLYSFHGGIDGGQPLGKLMRDSAGNIFGTAEYGGSKNFGNVFRLSPDGTLTVLYSFSGGSDGAYPAWGRPVRDDSGNLYDTTGLGGALKCYPPNGCGVVFKLTPKGTEKVLHAFHGGRDGSFPLGGVRTDKQGNLYGTTGQGGGSPNCDGGCGTIFKIAPDGTETILHSFDGNDGYFADSPPIADKMGNLYGSAAEGGIVSQECPDGCGVIYKLGADGRFVILYAFSGGNDGIYPTGGLRMGRGGSLFGNTGDGGTADGGTVFRLDPGGAKTTLYSFSGDDGLYPDRALAMDKRGYLYGTAGQGGSGGNGTVFKVKKRSTSGSCDLC